MPDTWDYWELNGPDDIPIAESDNTGRGAEAEGRDMQCIAALRNAATQLLDALIAAAREREALRKDKEQLETIVAEYRRKIMEVNDREAGFGSALVEVHERLAGERLVRSILALAATGLKEPNLMEMHGEADDHGDCPNCANPPHEGPCHRKYKD